MEECCVCGMPARADNQRYCHFHHAEAQKKYRDRLEEERKRFHVERQKTVERK